MKILFLDDERMPSDVTWINYPENAEFTVVRTYNEFLEEVRIGQLYDAWSLDHDLGPDDMSGYDALKAAIRWHHPAQFPKQVIAHSKNPVGANNITQYWRNYLENLDGNRV